MKRFLPRAVHLARQLGALAIAAQLGACQKQEMSSALLPAAASGPSIAVGASSAPPASAPASGSTPIGAASASDAASAPVIVQGPPGASFSLEASGGEDWFTISAAAAGCAAAESPAQKLDELQTSGVVATATEKSDGNGQVTETLVEWVAAQSAPAAMRFFRTLKACQDALPSEIPKAHR
jgi:hypothetical protein